MIAFVFAGCAMDGGVTPNHAEPPFVEAERTGKNVTTSRAPATRRAKVVAKADKEVWGLVLKAIHPGYLKSQTVPEALRRLKAMEPDRALAAFAHDLRDESRRHYVLRFVRRHWPDKQYGPYVAELIRGTKGAMLLEAVKTAKAIPDACLVGPLVGHALVSEYVQERLVATVHGGETSRTFLAAEAAQALHAITGGKAGIAPVSNSEFRRWEPEQRKAYVARWQDWWKKNKSEWPSGSAGEAHRQPGAARRPRRLRPAPGMQAYELISRPSDHGLIRLGDRVDFYCYVSLGGKPPKAYTLLENVRVLAFGKVTRQPRWQGPITIEVSPDVARDLAKVMPKLIRIGVICRHPKETKPPLPGVNPVIKRGLGIAAPP